MLRRVRMPAPTSTLLAVTPLAWHTPAAQAISSTTTTAGVLHDFPCIDVEKHEIHVAVYSEVLQRAPGLQGLNILPFVVAAYNTKKGAMEFIDEKNKADYLFISGTKMRTLAKNGESLPDGFMCPGGWKVLADYYLSLASASS